MMNGFSNIVTIAAWVMGTVCVVGIGVFAAWMWAASAGKMRGE